MVWCMLRHFPFLLSSAEVSAPNTKMCFTITFIKLSRFWRNLAEANAVLWKLPRKLLASYTKRDSVLHVVNDTLALVTFNFRQILVLESGDNCLQCFVENLFKKQSAKFLQNRPSFMKIMMKHILVCFYSPLYIYVCIETYTGMFVKCLQRESCTLLLNLIMLLF